MTTGQYCATCNAPRKDAVAILLRCGGCVVRENQAPTKYVPIKEQS